MGNVPLNLTHAIAYLSNVERGKDKHEFTHVPPCVRVCERLREDVGFFSDVSYTYKITFMHPDLMKPVSKHSMRSVIFCIAGLLQVLRSWTMAWLSSSTLRAGDRFCAQRCGAQVRGVERETHPCRSDCIATGEVEGPWTYEKSCCRTGHEGTACVLTIREQMRGDIFQATARPAHCACMTPRCGCSA